MYKPTPHFVGFILAIALIAFAGGAFAADVTVSGTNATQNTDGSAIPTDGSANSLRDVRIRYGTCNSGKTAVATVTKTVTVAATVPGAAFSTPVTGLLLQEYCFQARHSNVGDTYSDWTAAVVRDLTPTQKKPRPPGNISVASLYEDMRLSAQWAADAFAPIVLNLGG